MRIQIEEGTNKEELIDILEIFPDGKIVIENGNVYWDFEKKIINNSRIKPKVENKNISGTFDRMGDYLNGVFST